MDETNDVAIYKIAGMFEDATKNFMLRCADAYFAGGIHNATLVEQNRLAPHGYWFDERTQYWLPPHFQFDNSQEMH